jgi:hypothetical protein
MAYVAYNPATMARVEDVGPAVAKQKQRVEHTATPTAAQVRFISAERGSNAAGQPL